MKKNKKMNKFEIGAVGCGVVGGREGTERGLVE